MVRLNYYKILGIGKGATTDQVRKAYLKKAQYWHPDVNKRRDATRRFQDISEAFFVLGNRNLREKYDRDLSSEVEDEVGYDIFRDPEFDTIRSEETRVLGPRRNIFLERCLEVYRKILEDDFPRSGSMIDLYVE